MRYYVTTGTSLSEDSRCWFTQEELDAARDRGTPPTRDDAYDEYANLWELLDAGALPDYEAVQFIKTERSRCLRFKTDNAAGLGLDESKVDVEYASEARKQVMTWFDLGCWEIEKRHLLSAELCTLLAMSKLKQGQQFLADDEICFIGGKSNRAESVISCEVLRWMAEQGKFGVRQDNITCHPGIENRDLDPIHQYAFRPSMSKLWSEVRPSGDNPKASFVLTGGYKGVGLAITSRIKTETTDIYYLHDNAALSERDGYGVVIINIEDGIPQ